MKKSSYHGDSNPPGIRNAFRFKTFRYDSMSAMITRNSGQALVGLIFRLCPAMGGKPSKFIGSSSRHVLGTLAAIAASQGLPGVVKYLKTVSVQTQQYLGGNSNIPFSPRVSRTNSGIPRIFPPKIRVGLRNFNTFFIRWSLTISSLYRDIVYEGPLKLNSIIDPFCGNVRIFNEIGNYIPLFKKALLKEASISKSMRHWLIGKYKAFPISTSSPQKDRDPVCSSSPLVLVKSAFALSDDMIQHIQTLEQLYFPDKEYKAASFWIKTIKTVSWLPSFAKPKHSVIGKLGLKVESAGKMRVFAMVDPWTQFVLAPIHKGIFHVIGKLPQDGTFNQHKPLQAAFRGKTKPLFSMDLSSATDRLPLILQKSLLASLFEMTDFEAEAWGKLLVGRTYALSSKMQNLLTDKSISEVTYSVGQPMGALSSWAMLALTHHFIVQVAAWQSGSALPGAWFKDYAVLGDDIVIFNAATAKKYHKLITSLGVECNLAKSVISPKGLALEFAKKTFIKGGIDVSPIPFKELYASLDSVPSLVEFGRKYHLSLAQLLKTAGFGYKVLGGLSKPLNKLNIKIQYVIFGFMAMDPQALRESFYGIVRFRNEANLLKAYILFCNKWISEVHQRMSAEVEMLNTHTFWSKHTITKKLGYGYGRDLYNMVYETSVQRMISLREAFVEDVGQRAEALYDFVKYDVSYYAKRNLPVVTASNVIQEISTILWATMSCYKKVISLPISTLSIRVEKSQHFSFGKGMPALYNKHKAFIELLHRKEPPMKESSLIPVRVIGPILRRLAYKKLGSRIKLQMIRKLVSGGISILSITSAVSFAALVFGPIEILALVSNILIGFQSVSSTIEILDMSYLYNVVERLIILILFLSGIIMILNGEAVLNGLRILKEQLDGGMSIYDYLIEVIKLFSSTTVDLLVQYGTPVLEVATHSPWYTGFTVGAIGSYMLWLILKWIFSI